MKRRYKESLRTAINVVIALALMALLFSTLPGLRSVGPPKVQETVAVLIDRKTALDMKKEEVKQRRIPTQMMRSIQTQARATADRVANESFKFTPDLGIQGAGDVAVPDRRQVRSQVFSEEETDVRPMLAARCPIPYPPEARKKGIEGVADLEILVDESGRVVKINFNQMPSELFRAPVTDAVMRWRFKPAQVKGVAVSVRVRQKITFRLSQASN
jgi:TonB family protein